jgi:hypothetical protein
MQEKQPWALPDHPLRFPVDLADGRSLASVSLRPFSVAEHRAAIAKAGADEDDHFEALLRLASGLSEEELGEIKRPDYVTLSTMIHEYVSLPASYFLERLPEDPDDVELLVPVKGIGRTIDRLQLQVPGMKVTKAMRKMKTDNERADFCSASCTGLSVPEIQRLSIPDWTQLQGRLNDFLNKPAAYFQ